MTAFDRRTTPARPDLAALSLKGQVEALAYVAGKPARVTVPVAPLRRAPADDAALDTEVLSGETVMIYDRAHGWAWVQLQQDNYVGYVPEQALSKTAALPTHRLAVLRSFAYPAASMKLPPVAHYSLGAMVTVIGESGDFAELADGSFIWRPHLAPLDQFQSDTVTVAEQFLGTPYLWGGKTSLGLDCSGLTQLALSGCGIEAPRDSDMQEVALGRLLPVSADLSGLQRGDLVFWKGHVGLMQDETRLLHANGHHMLVVSEPLAEAASRIASKGAGPITSIRRLG
jgi:cell wall-associated NlpC family hydrolase